MDKTETTDARTTGSVPLAAKEEQLQKRAMLIARVVMVLAAVVLVAAFFLPWASADAEYRDAAEQFPDTMYYEPTGLTVSDAADLSLMEYAQVYGSMSGTGWVIYQYLMFGLLAVSVGALVFSAVGLPVGSMLFGLFSLALTLLLRWDFIDRAILPNDTHTWGIALTLYIGASVVILVASVVLAVLKHRAKAARKS